jgi:hypothetical protein
MAFWIRHIFLIIACVVGPFVAALYVDTQSEVKRTEHAGEIAGRIAIQGLEARLRLNAHSRVSQAISLAQRLQDRDLVGELMRSGAARKEAAFATVVDMLNESAPSGGFAWVVDDQGAVVAKNGIRTPEDEPQRITGHPIFLETQEGNALDGIWRDVPKTNALVGAAPLIVRGTAQGAVVIGQPIDRTLVESLASSLNAGITVALGDGTIVATTLDPETAVSLVKAQGNSVEPKTAGALKTPLSHEWLPLIPIFIDHQGRGNAYTSLAMTTLGSDVRWLVSIDATDALRALPARQQLILSGFAVFTMLAILIGLMNHRTFVSPIERITAHLSELHVGRGELEYPEAKVAAPFRRLVKLINMTVQKIPARGFQPRGSSAIESPISEISGGDRVPPPRDGSTSASLLRVGGDLSPPSIASDLMLRKSPPPPASTGNSPLNDLSFERAIQDNLLSRATPMPQQPPPPRAPPMEEDAQAIAQAIASLEGSDTTPMPQLQPPPSLSPPPMGSIPSLRPRGISSPRLEAGKMKSPRSAADIRGVPSESMGMPSPFMPSQSEMFRGTPGQLYPPRPDDQAQLDPRSNQGQARSGGSLAGYAALGAPSGLGASAGLGSASVPEDGAFNPEATVVAPVEEELLRKSAREESTGSYRLPNSNQALASPGGDMTMVASVPANLLAQTIADPETEVGDETTALDAADHAHFKETYERFIEMRKRCGEATGDLAFDRFLAKLTKNREGLIKKYNCRTVRFQVYEKDGKAALKATPVRAGGR